MRLHVHLVLIALGACHAEVTEPAPAEGGGAPIDPCTTPDGADDGDRCCHPPCLDDEETSELPEGEGPEDPCNAFGGSSDVATCCDHPECHRTHVEGLECISADRLCFAEDDSDNRFEAPCPPGYACDIASSADSKEVDGCVHDGEFDMDFYRRYCRWLGP